MTPELVAEHAAGLVVLLGPGSEVGQAIAARRPDLAARAARRWRDLGCEVVIEVVDHLDEPGSTHRAARMAELARAGRLPVALTNAVRYLDPADSRVAQVLDAARQLVPLGSPRLTAHGGRAYLASGAEMAAIAGRIARVMDARVMDAAGSGGPAAGGPRTVSAATWLLCATAELAARCALDPAADLGVGSRHLPGAAGPADALRELRARCEPAIASGRYRSRPARAAARAAAARLEHELNIIAATGTASYFLTVADITERIRSRGIRCAIRGSGTGSLVNHLLGISAIDPLEHGLLMERFLSEARATLPDIDLDVESARRLEAYRIIIDAYGQERTACVCMMETYRARGAIRDVAAAMSLPPDETGRIARAFPHIRARHITSALAELPELRGSGLSAARLGTVFSLAEKLDGLPRHVAMHPCGVLLSDATLRDRTAVQRSAEGFPLSHLDKDDAEIAGVIKLDVLGVRMQSAMAYTVAEIGRATGETVDLDAVPRDDERVYAMIAAARTLGCFQIESPGQRELVRKLAPRDVGDLIVDISLFRPGPVNSDMITPFLRTRHGVAAPRFPHEKLRDALAETGGVVVFHEQVLRILDVMTGCGLAEADLIRRHLSAEQGPRRTEAWFRAAARGRGYDPVTVDRVWRVLAAFGGFGFCKAHAAAFAVPVYQSAWLKRHYPAAFYAGVLTHDPGMYPKRVIVADARLAGIPVLPVDINASADGWKVEKIKTSKTSSITVPWSPARPPLAPDSTPGTPGRHLLPAGDGSAGDGSAGDGSGAEPPRFTAAPRARPTPPAGFRAPATGPGRADAGEPRAREIPGRADPVARPSGWGDLSIADVSRSGVPRPGNRQRPVPARQSSPRGSGHGGLPAPHPPGPWGLPDGKARISGRRSSPGGSGHGGLFSGMGAPAPVPRAAPHPPGSRTPRSLPGGEASVPGRRADGIRVSLREVKGISDAEVARIVAGQPYTSLRDFWERARVSRPVAERLALVGAFDLLYAEPGPPWMVPSSRATSATPASGSSRPLARPTRRDLLARVGVLARGTGRPGQAHASDLFAAGAAGLAGPQAGAADGRRAADDGLESIVPAGQLRDLDPAERVAAELDILGFDVSRHVLEFYAGLLDGLGVVRSPDLAGRRAGETVLVAGVKVATQTPAVRSGQRIIFATLDDAAGLVDLAFFESVQQRCAARLFASWLLLVRGRVRRSGAGPTAVTVNATECWDIPALEEIRAARGIAAVRTAIAAEDVAPGGQPAPPADAVPPDQTPEDQQSRDQHPGDQAPGERDPGNLGPGERDLGRQDPGERGPGEEDPGGQDPGNLGPGGQDPGERGPGGREPGGRDAARPLVFANGFTLSPYAETGTPGSPLKNPPRTLWHASPGSPSS